jgi:hypothetical protein
MLPVLIHPRTNLTTPALAALLHTSQSTLGSIINQLVPIQARAGQPNPDGNDRGSSTAPLLPVHDQTNTAPANKYHAASPTRSSSAPAGAAWW